MVRSILGIEDVAGRSSIHVVCPNPEYEEWLDSASGLLLARFNPSTGPGGDATGRFTSIEFDSELDDALFDARS